MTKKKKNDMQKFDFFGKSSSPWIWKELDNLYLVKKIKIKKFKDSNQILEMSFFKNWILWKEARLVIGSHDNRYMFQLIRSHKTHT